MAATRGVLAQPGGPHQGAERFYERGPVRSRYYEVGTGYPLLVIPGGGLNSVMAGLETAPFNPMEEFKGE